MSENEKKMKQKSPPPRRTRPRDFLIPILVGGAIWFAMMYFRGGFTAPDPVTYLMLLCDAFFVPGVLLGGAGLLVVVADGGAFDALHFGVQKLFSLIRSEEKRSEMPKTYFDFVTLRHGKKSGAPLALLLTGAGFLLAAGIVLVLYIRAEA